MHHVRENGHSASCCCAAIDMRPAAQIIACSSDIHILAPGLDKRDWALIFGVRCLSDSCLYLPYHCMHERAVLLLLWDAPVKLLCLFSPLPAC